MHASCILSLLEMTHPIVFRIYTLRNVMNKIPIFYHRKYLQHFKLCNFGWLGMKNEE